MKIKQEKKQLNEFAPVVWGALEGLAWLGTAIGATTISYQYGRLSHDDQQMREIKNGFFEPNMWVGEAFQVINFTGNETVQELMDIDNLEKKTGWKSYSDEHGIYLKLAGSSINSTTDLRLYLPKKEWFEQFTGKVRKIIDKKLGETKSNTFTLCFYLKTPKNAIRVTTLKSDGSEYVGPPQNSYDIEKGQWVDDPSRGWAVLDTYKQSGYFKMGGDVFSDIVTTESYKKETNVKEQIAPTQLIHPDPLITFKKEQDRKITNLQDKISKISSQPPSGLIEYEWNTYGQKYGNSEFDNWYDGSNGTWIIVGTQVLASIVVTPIAVEWASAARTLGAYNARKYGLIIGTELAVGGWESLYLYNRGMTDQAALVFFCCFLPILTEGVLAARIVGLPPNYNDLVMDIAYKAEKGSITPADIKSWLDGLPAGIKEQVKDSMTLVAQYFKKNPTTLVQQKVLKSMSEKIKEMKKLSKGVSTPGKQMSIQDIWKLPIQDQMKWFKAGESFVKRAQNYSKAFGLTIQKGSYEGLKTLGLNLLAVGALLPVCFIAIGSDENFLNDPQKILTAADKTVKSFITYSPKQEKKLREKMTSLATSIYSSYVAGDKDKAVKLSKEYFQVLNDLSFIGDNEVNWGNIREYSKIVEEFRKNTIVELKVRFHNALSQGEENEKDFCYKKMKELDDKEADKMYMALFNCDYLKPSDGFFSDVDGKTYTLDFNKFKEFIIWFNGIDIVTKDTSKKSSSYYVKNKINFEASYKYKDKETLHNMNVGFRGTMGYDLMLKIISEMVDYNTITNPKYPFVNFTSIQNVYNIGNLFFLRKIFTEYYDEFLCEKYSICPTVENK